jgi:hypothetical protein
MASSFLNTAGKVGRVTISERIEAGRRERRVLTRVSRAAWRLEQAERERAWALVSARAEGISIRTLAAAVGLSPSRVHQIVAAADLDALDAALGELRAAGWPAPEDPDSGEDTELDGRDSIADRLSDEVSWLRQCADWLAHLDADSYPPAVNLRPSADWPDRAARPPVRRAGRPCRPPSWPGSRGRLSGRGRVGAGQEGQDFADGAFPAGGVWQREVRLDVVAVAAAVLLLDHVAGLDQVGDDAEGAALGNVQAGRDVAQAHPGVMSDAQQNPGVVGQERPARHPDKLPGSGYQIPENYC